MVEYIGARRAESEHRWMALLDAALNQPHPTAEMTAALKALEKRHWTQTHPEIAVRLTRTLKQYQGA